MAPFRRNTTNSSSGGRDSTKLVSEPVLEPLTEDSREGSSSHGGSGGIVAEESRLPVDEGRIISMENTMEILSGTILDLKIRFDKFEDKLERMMGELTGYNRNLEVLNQQSNSTPTPHHTIAAQSPFPSIQMSNSPIHANVSNVLGMNPPVPNSVVSSTEQTPLGQTNSHHNPSFPAMESMTSGHKFMLMGLHMEPEERIRILTSTFQKYKARRNSKSFEELCPTVSKSATLEVKPCADVKTANQRKVAGLVPVSEELHETSMQVIRVSKIDAPVDQLLESSWDPTNIAAWKTEVHIWDPGQIGYAIAPMTAQGTILGPDQSVILHLLDISHAAEVVRLMQGLASVSEQDKEVDFIVDVLVSRKLTLLMEKNIFIFDPGGGILDVHIITIDNEAFDVLSTNGDTHLRSEDLDHRTMEYFKLIKEKSQIFTTYQDQPTAVQGFEGEKRLPHDCRGLGLLQYKVAAIAMHASLSTRLWDPGI